MVGWGQPWDCGHWLRLCGGAEFLGLRELLLPSDPGWIPNLSLEISHESPGSSQCLLEHLLTRLQSSSCHVKLKVGLCWWHWGGDGMEIPCSREGSCDLSLSPEAGAEDLAAHLLPGLPPVCPAAEKERQLHPRGCG